MFRTFLRTVFVILNNLYCVPSYLIWMFVIHPFKPLCPPLYDAVEGTLYSWLLKVVASWIWSANVVVEEAGDSLDDCIDEKSLVICNHQSTSDVPLLMYFLSSKPRLAKMTTWVMTMIFKYSHFGWVSQVHHDYFIKQGKDTRAEQLVLFREFLLSHYSSLNRKWLILFPEGGFYYKRKETSQQYAAKNGYVHLDFCTLPRIGALSIALSTLLADKDSETEAAHDDDFDARSTFCNCSVVPPTTTKNIPKRSQLKWIVDLTICYPEGNAPSIFDLVARRTLVSPLYKIIVICRKYPVSTVKDMSDGQLQTWLFERWAEKDEMLRMFYETGRAFLPRDGERDDIAKEGEEEEEVEVQRPDEDVKNGIKHATSPHLQGSDPKSPRRIEMTATPSRPVGIELCLVILLHLFFIASTYFHYSVISFVLSSFVSCLYWVLDFVIVA